MKKLQIAMLAILACGALSVRATLVVTETGVSPVQVVNLHSPFVSGGVYAGIYNILVNGVAMPAFCIDVQRDGPNATADYYRNSLSDSPLPNTGPMGGNAANEISKLWAAYFPAAQSSSLDAAALQVAIWERVGVGKGYAVSIDGGDVNNRANAMIASLGGLSAVASLEALVSPTKQNFVVLASGFTAESGFNDPTPVPESSTMIGGALMLLPFGVGMMRKLRANRAA